MDGFFSSDNAVDIKMLEKVKHERAKRVFSTVGLAFAVFTLTRLVAQLAIEVVITLFFAELKEAWWMSWMLSVVPMYVFALPVLMLLLYKLPVFTHNGEYTVRTRLGEPDEVREKPKFGYGKLPVVFVVSMGLMYIGSFIGEGLMDLIGRLVGYDYSNMLGVMAEATPWWFTAIMSCIIAPLGEEFIFRRLLIDRTRRYGDLTAIFISAVSFGLFHMNFYQFFYALFIGFVLAYVYTLTGKLRYTVAIHATVNFVGSVLIPKIASGVDYEVLESADAEALTAAVYQNPVSYLLYFATAYLIYALMIASVIILVLKCKKLALTKCQVEFKTRRLISDVLGNPGVITALLIMLLLFAINLTPLS